MRIVFVQLPVQDPAWESARANVPLAAAYLIALAEKRGLARRRDCLILPDEVSDYGGDEAVLEAVLGRSPDMVCFSLYAWNLERSAFIATRLKERAPGLMIVGGGPEVSTGMPVFDDPLWDVLVEGEGEEAFCEFLADLGSGRGHGRRYKATKLVDLSELPNPYLEGLLPIRADKQVYLETMRGCPYRCGYCYYGKNFGSVRRYPEESAYEVMRLAGEKGARELYLMDPSFQAQDNLEGRLAKLAYANKAGLVLHTEIRAESVTEELAMLYADAGFASAEVGLQSVNDAALKAVGRTWDRKAFELGARALFNQGLRVKTGLILGLPYDDYEAVIRTFDFMGMLGLGQDAELYPLSLLPGTSLRDRAGEFGISYLDAPPYWVVSTKWLSSDDIGEAIAAFEESFDVEWAPLAAPHFSAPSGGYVSFIDGREKEALDRALLNPGMLANSITVLVDADDDDQAQAVARAARGLRKANPSALWQIALYSNKRVPRKKVADRLLDAFAFPEHYYERSHLYSLDPQRVYQTRLFFVTKDSALAAAAVEEGTSLEILFYYDGRETKGLDYLYDMLPFAAFDPRAIPFEAIRDLMAVYADYRHLLVEAPAELFR